MKAKKVFEAMSDVLAPKSKKEIADTLKQTHKLADVVSVRVDKEWSHRDMGTFCNNIEVEDLSKNSWKITGKLEDVLDCIQSSYWMSPRHALKFLNKNLIK